MIKTSCMVLALSFVISLSHCQFPSTKYSLPAAIKNEIDEIALKILKFDVSRTSASLQLTDDRFQVGKPTLVDSWSLAVAKEGFSTGKYYFHFRIRSGDNSVLYGVYDDSALTAYTTSFYPSLHGGDGVVYEPSSGIIYFQQTYFLTGVTGSAGAYVGIYLNMDESSVTFFINNKKVGSAKLPSNNVKYYPAVSIYSASQVQVVAFY